MTIHSIILYVDKIAKDTFGVEAASDLRGYLVPLSKSITGRYTLMPYIIEIALKHQFVIVCGDTNKLGYECEITFRGRWFVSVMDSLRKKAWTENERIIQYINGQYEI